MGMFSGIIKTVQRLHLNYNMITSLYMMEPMERTIINCVVILVLSLMMYSSWVYLPHYTLKLLYFSGILPKGQFGDFEDEEEHVNVKNVEL